MKEEEAFKYCPVCGAKSLLDGKIDGLKCQSCGFDFFLNPKPASVAVIFDETGRILMTKRKIDPFKGYWDLPSGFIKKSENAETALEREMKEELNVNIEIRNYFYSFESEYDYKGLTYIPLDFAFLCNYRGNFTAKDDVAAFKFFSKEELPNQITPHHKKFIKKLISSGKLN